MVTGLGTARDKNAYPDGAPALKAAMAPRLLTREERCNLPQGHPVLISCAADGGVEWEARRRC